MKNTKIKIKLLIYFLSIGIGTIIILSILSYRVSKNSIENRIEQQLTAIRDIQKNRIDNYITERIADIDILSRTEIIHQLFDNLLEYHNRRGVQAHEPFPSGSEEYDRIQSQYDDFLKRYMEAYGYYDIFMICRAHGHVMYTVAKENDLGANLEHGQYRETTLADLWREVVNTQSLAIADYQPYAPSNNAQAMFMAVPVIRNGEFIAVLGVQVSEEPVDNILNERTGLGTTGESFLIGMLNNETFMRNNRVVQEHNIGFQLSNPIYSESLKNREPVYTTKQSAAGETYFYAFAPVSSELLNWGVAVEITESEVLQPIIQMRRIIVVISLIIAIAIVFAAMFIARSFTTPIDKTVKFVDAITEGNYDATIDINQKDEIGQLIEALRKMVEVFKKGYLSTKEIAAGNLLQTELEKKNLKKGTLGESLQSMSEKLREVVTTVKTIADSVASGSNQISNSSVQIAQGANEQAAAAEEISSSMEEMSATIEQNTDNAKKTKRVSAEAVEKIRKSQKSFEETLNAIENITKKISIITEIAEKTDVLAINVAIEAARAGEHGKGFDVLALEVRKLAEISKGAAKEITAISSQTIESSKVSGKLLKEVVPTIEETARLIGEIADSGDEQLRGSLQISESVNQLSEVTQENSSASEEMSSGSEQLSAQAEELKNAVAYFKIEKK